MDAALGLPPEGAAPAPSLQPPLLLRPETSCSGAAASGSLHPGGISDAECSAGWATWEGLEDKWAGTGIVRKVREGGLSPPHRPAETEGVSV